MPVSVPRLPLERLHSPATDTQDSGAARPAISAPASARTYSEGYSVGSHSRRSSSSASPYDGLATSRSVSDRGTASQYTPNYYSNYHTHVRASVASPSISVDRSDPTSSHAPVLGARPSAIIASTVVSNTSPRLNYQGGSGSNASIPGLSSTLVGVNNSSNSSNTTSSSNSGSILSSRSSSRSSRSRGVDSCASASTLSSSVVGGSTTDNSSISAEVDSVNTSISSPDLSPVRNENVAAAANYGNLTMGTVLTVSGHAQQATPAVEAAPHETPRQPYHAQPNQQQQQHSERSVSLTSVQAAFADAVTSSPAMTQRAVLSTAPQTSLAISSTSGGPSPSEGGGISGNSSGGVLARSLRGSSIAATTPTPRPVPPQMLAPQSVTEPPAISAAVHTPQAASDQGVPPPANVAPTRATAGAILVARPVNTLPPGPVCTTTASVDEFIQIQPDLERLLEEMKQCFKRAAAATQIREADLATALATSEAALAAERKDRGRLLQRLAVLEEGRGLETLSDSRLERLENDTSLLLGRVKEHRAGRAARAVSELQARLAIMEEERKLWRAAEEEKKNSSQCKICLENTADMVIVPCGHRVCAPCRATPYFSQSHRCHICRGFVENIVKVFSS